uniref:Uncharacterized protein n=1 Tax=Globodera rostochiensis TaxID=31243 RepID=A0A914GUQ5_GLORO
MNFLLCIQFVILMVKCFSGQVATRRLRCVHATSGCHSAICFLNARVQMKLGWVEFKAVFRDVWKGVNWTFSWSVIDGMDNARFAGMDGPSLNLTNLKAGFVLLTLSVSNATSEGHMSHNLTITDESKYSVRIVECERRANTEFIRLWLPFDKKLRLSGDSAEIVSNKWVRIDHTMNPVDISGSTSSVLELSNFQITNESSPYEFLLSVAFPGGRSSNATVKISVQDRPKVPVIHIRNETIQLPVDSVLLKAQILNNSVDVFVNFTWEQTEGPFQVEFANRHLLSPSIVGQIGIPGLYVFRVHGITIAEDIADAQLFLNVLPEKNDRLRPVILGDNVSVFLPLKYVVLEPMLWRNIDTFTWTPGDNVPAVMLIQSDFHTPTLLLSHLLPGNFLFKIFGYTKMLLQQNFGGDFVPNTNGIFDDGNREILSLRLIFTCTPGSDGRVNLTESKLASVLRNNRTFLEKFKIISIHPTCTSRSDADCGCNSFWMGSLFIFYTKDGQTCACWPVFYAWLPIFQEGEDKTLGDLEQNPISSPRKSKCDTVNKALVNGNYETLLDNELEGDTSDFEEDDSL